MSSDLQKTGGTEQSVPPVSTSMIIVLCTFPDQEKAAQIATEIVTEGLAACANIIPSVRSIYRWEGKIHDEAEALAIFKLKAAGFEKLELAILAKHPYDTPEIIALTVEQATDKYLRWVCGER